LSPMARANDGQSIQITLSQWTIVMGAQIRNREIFSGNIENYNRLMGNFNESSLSVLQFFLWKNIIKLTNSWITGAVVEHS